jgi:ABC-type amino acid transport system permease subunit
VVGAGLTVPIILIDAAVVAEIVRAGIDALDRGQSERRSR